MKITKQKENPNIRQPVTKSFPVTLLTTRRLSRKFTWPVRFDVDKVKTVTKNKSITVTTINIP